MRTYFVFTALINYLRQFDGGVEGIGVSDLWINTPRQNPKYATPPNPNPAPVIVRPFPLVKEFSP